MEKNTLIGLLVAIVVIGGGVWLFTSGSGTTDNTTATTTPTGTTPVATTPSAPSTVTGTLVVASNSSAVLTGKVVPNGAQTTYWYEYGSTSALGSRTDSQSIGSGYLSISAPVFVAGLAPNATYSYRLVAGNVYGTVNGTILSFKTNTNPPPTGSAPKAGTDAVSAILRTSANLNGHVTANGADTSFWFEYGTSNDLGNTTAFQSAGSGTNSITESLAVSGLLPVTKYYFRMNAQNQFGTVNGAILTFTTAGPGAVAQPTADTTPASTVTSTKATLNGKVNPNGAATTYWFEYSKDSLLGSILGSTTHQSTAGAGTSSVDVTNNLTGLSGNTSYFYRVVASNSQGTTQGDIVSFKTK